MDLIIVDGDCRNLWTAPELEKLLDASHDKIWFWEDAALRKYEYNAASAARSAIGATFERAILVTRLQSGVMSYHKKMLRSTVGCKRWLIVIVGEDCPVYREQYCNEINSILGGAIRYEVLFDEPSEMKLTLEAKREVVEDGPFCIIATRSDAELAACVKSALASANESWRFECHVGLKEDRYRHADIILVVGRTEEDCAVPPTNENTRRVRIWVESPRGRHEENREKAVLDCMNRNGWNLGHRHVWSSCLVNEILLRELDRGELSGEALCGDDRFVMWDRYGLPLAAKAYEPVSGAEVFLRGQCCFSELLK